MQNKKKNNKQASHKSQKHKVSQRNRIQNKKKLKAFAQAKKNFAKALDNKTLSDQQKFQTFRDLDQVSQQCKGILHKNKVSRTVSRAYKKVAKQNLVYSCLPHIKQGQKHHHATPSKP